MGAGEREVPGAPATEDPPAALLLLERALDDGRGAGRQEGQRALGPRAQEAAPGAAGVPLEHVEEAGGPQLVHQQVLVLERREGARDQREEGLVLALEDVPAVLEAGQRGVARGQRRGVAGLQRQEHEVHPHAGRAGAHAERRRREQAVRAAPAARERQPRVLLRAPLCAQRHHAQH